MFSPRLPLPPRAILRCHPERSEGSAFRRHLPPSLRRSSFTSPSNNATGPAQARQLPSPPHLRAHTNARNPLSFIRLLHSSFYTRVRRFSIATHQPTLASIPFRI